MRKQNCYYCKDEAHYLVSSGNLDRRPMCFPCAKPFACSLQYAFEKLFEGQPWKAAKRKTRG